MTKPAEAGETRRDALRRLERVFAAADLPEARADAGILVEDATGLSRAQLIADGDKLLGPAAAARLEAFAVQRLARVPVFRIIGRRAFWGLDLTVTPAVLDPRPDTETIVEASLEGLKAVDRPPRLLDLGTGSGAILCALLAERVDAFGIGVDRSEAAGTVARANLIACGCAERGAIVVSDWAGCFSGPFDLIVSNPPYIETAVIATLDPEVRDHDPILALDGGADGLDAYRGLAPQTARLLAPGGLVVFEVGSTQAASVATLLREAGLPVADIRRDLGGRERAVVARKPG